MGGWGGGVRRESVGVWVRGGWVWCERGVCVCVCEERVGVVWGVCVVGSERVCGGVWVVGGREEERVCGE